MKTNELMVGDWVYMKAHRGFDSQYIKVESIPDPSSDTHYGHIGSYPISDDMDFRDIEDSHLEPIPITRAILEKNGFESDNNMFGLCDYELSKSYILENRVDRFYFVKRFPGHCHSTFFIIEVRFIHELQHCLKLFGINKTIEL